MSKIPDHTNRILFALINIFALFLGGVICALAMSAVLIFICTKYNTGLNPVIALIAVGLFGFLPGAIFSINSLRWRREINQLRIENERLKHEAISGTCSDK